MRTIKLLLIPTILFACTSKPKGKGNIHKDELLKNKIEIQNNSIKHSIDYVDSVLIGKVGQNDHLRPEPKDHPLAGAN
jgi:hypothetical protein